VATKWLPLLRTAANIPATIANRQRELDGYRIGLYMIHQPWSLSPPESEMEAMAGLMAAGKIRAVGVSNFNAARMRRAARTLARQGLPLAANQMRFSLLHREIETNGVLDAARELGVTIIAYTPLASGLLTGKYHRDPALLARLPRFRRSLLARQVEPTRPLVEALTEMAARHGVTAAQVALNWTVSVHGETVVAIPGATKVHQAQEAAGAMAFQLTGDEMARLDELSRPRR
jgi:aryl-alcohol dehydrogenase-like predicted oxidoreductase